MESPYFPMFMDLSDRKILVAGGGRIATRRVQTLIMFAKKITVIAPAISPEILSLAKEGKVVCRQSVYKTGEAAGADFVFAATDNRELNRQIAEECREAARVQSRRIFVNVADDRTLCDFYFPAVIQNEDITIGINSAGGNPGKVKKLRQELEQELENRSKKL